MSKRNGADGWPRFFISAATVRKRSADSEWVVLLWPMIMQLLGFYAGVSGEPTELVDIS